MPRLPWALGASLLSMMVAVSAQADGASAQAGGALAQAGGAADQPDRLAPLMWKARPLVVLSGLRDDPRVAKQISALDHDRPGLTERNIEVLREAQPKSALRKRLGVAERGFAVVLIGKDGGVKKVWRKPVDASDIFTIIDQMPMRRDEMRG